MVLAADAIGRQAPDPTTSIWVSAPNLPADQLRQRKEATPGLETHLGLEMRPAQSLHQVRVLLKTPKVA